MINNFDRSHYFGGSEGRYIFAENTGSKSWNEWWSLKCGTRQSIFGGNTFTEAGNTWEHSILKAFNPNINFDRQIIIEDLRLRVNYDGDYQDFDGSVIVECKTHRIDKPFVISDNYWQQSQMQIYAWEHQKKIPEIFVVGLDLCDTMKFKKHIIISYGLYSDEYCVSATRRDIEEGNLKVDRSRIQVHEVKRSRGFQHQIPKRLKKLVKRLEREEVK